MKLARDFRVNLTTNFLTFPLESNTAAFLARIYLNGGGQNTITKKRFHAKT